MYRIKYWKKDKHEFWNFFVDFSSKREAVEAARSIQGAPHWQVWELYRDIEAGQKEEKEMVAEGPGGWN